MAVVGGLWCNELWQWLEDYGVMSYGSGWRKVGNESSELGEQLMVVVLSNMSSFFPPPHPHFVPISLFLLLSRYLLISSFARTSC